MFHTAGFANFCCLSVDTLKSHWIGPVFAASRDLLLITSVISWGRSVNFVISFSAFKAIELLQDSQMLHSCAENT